MTDLLIPEYDPSTLVRSITVEIEAPPAVVWEVLLDLDNYGRWNPFCVAAKSALAMGSAVEMVLAGKYSGTNGTWLHTEYVCAIVPQRLLSWEQRATAESPYAARRDQIIEPWGDLGCRYYSTDAFLGQHAAQVMTDTGSWVKRAFDDTALALKQYSERGYRSRTSAAS
ncbi:MULTISPECIES: SRPBCC domain-containing protein [unclassified Mycobacterium]|uniref:SRPBCC domain-containing protein n=1 Tax=unclassified Mycobacterium TaxID=2642494 RepID=UPI0007FCC691|nr:MULTISPECIES: SRPBCC domain-containing protein [unclassified Mycobacterium]OBG98219.1 polyketide cyclase [Mycobacterium sp. E3247]OBI19560.1 polyketide cyclase [Mycobacterium sp. E2497]